MRGTHTERYLEGHLLWMPFARLNGLAVLEDTLDEGEGLDDARFFGTVIGGAFNAPGTLVTCLLQEANGFGRVIGGFVAVGVKGIAFDVGEAGIFGDEGPSGFVRACFPIQGVNEQAQTG